MTTDWGKLRYGWSKYGGAMHGLVKNEGTWFCQTCGEEQPEEVGAYMLPIDSFMRDFIRVCAVCKHTQNNKKITYYRLIKIVRKDG